MGILDKITSRFTATHGIALLFVMMVATVAAAVVCVVMLATGAISLSK
jgi:hypothetical protein